MRFDWFHLFSSIPTKYCVPSLNHHHHDHAIATIPAKALNSSCDIVTCLIQVTTSLSLPLSFCAVHTYSSSDFPVNASIDGTVHNLLSASRLLSPHTYRMSHIQNSRCDCYDRKWNFPFHKIRIISIIGVSFNFIENLQNLRISSGLLYTFSSFYSLPHCC